MTRYTYDGGRVGMRALTLWQPWAWAVAAGIKLVENRPWAAPDWLHGRDFAIHAGKRWDEASHDKLTDALVDKPINGVGWLDVPDRDDLAAGAVIAVVRLQRQAVSVDTVRSLVGDEQARFFFGPYGWILGHVRRIEPVTCRGFQGLWTMPPDIESTVRHRAREVRP